MAGMQDSGSYQKFIFLSIPMNAAANRFHNLRDSRLVQFNQVTEHQQTEALSNLNRLPESVTVVSSYITKHTSKLFYIIY
jgi:hypothetical protein